MKKKLFGGLAALVKALVNVLSTLFVGKRERFAYVVTRRLYNAYGEDATYYPVSTFRTEKRAMEYMRKKYAAYTYDDLRDNKYAQTENRMCRWSMEDPDDEPLYTYEEYCLYKVPLK